MWVDRRVIGLILVAWVADCALSVVEHGWSSVVISLAIAVALSAALVFAVRRG